MTYDLKHPLTIFTIGCLCALIAIFGMAGWLQAVWFVDPGPFASNQWHGYTLPTFIGLLGFTFFTTIAVALVLVAVSQGARRASSDSVEAAMRWNSVRVGLGFTFILIGCCGMFTWSWEIFQCLGVFCVGSGYQEPNNLRPLAGNGWLVIVGAAAFFSLIPIGCIMIRASWNSLLHPSPIKNIAGCGSSITCANDNVFTAGGGGGGATSPLLGGGGDKNKPSAQAAAVGVNNNSGSSPNNSKQNLRGSNHLSELGQDEEACYYDGPRTAAIKITRSTTADEHLRASQAGRADEHVARQSINSHVPARQQQQRNCTGDVCTTESCINKMYLTHEQLHQHNLLIRPLSHKYFLLRTFGIFLVLFLFFVTTLYIPNSWEYFSRSRIASNAANVATDQYTDNGNCSYGDSGFAGSYTCTDYSWSIFPTKNIVISRDLVLKLYPSNIFFFFYLFLVLLGGAFLHIAASKASWFTRVKMIGGGSGFGWRFSYAELAGWLLTVLMFTLFSIYWFHDHNFNTLGNAVTTGISKSERVARGFGQVAVAFMGLLMFPSSRSSVLHSTLGTSWEALLRVHRIFGYCMLICAFIHMVSWWVKYAELGQFPSNIIAVPLSVGSSADNFTVPVANWSTWVLFVCMLFLAFEPVRRRWFELFYYAHLFAAYAAIPATLWHAAAGWEYLLPGVTVWFLDRLVRFTRSQRIVSLISTKVCDDGVTEIRFQQPGLVVRPGQYVFLNIAELSLLQWHPFSVSSIDNINHIFALHIKAMPSSDEDTLTWTQELRRAIQKNSISLTLSVDGPYGPLHEFNDFDSVILVAGGIGITPCASIAESLRNNADGMNMELHWCLREPELASDFIGQLSQGDNPNYNSTLYCSRPTATVQELSRRSGGFTVKAGRPNWEHLFKNYCANNGSGSEDPSKVLVFACGPAQLVDECAKAAIESGFTFHEETFFL